MTLPSDDPAKRRKKLYERGYTTVFACKADARFSYSLYVPEDFVPGEALNLIVTVHGSSRMQDLYRRSFGDFGRYNRCAILAPLFPVGVLGDDEADGYKYILEGDIRYDQVLLSMVSEVEARLGIKFDRFMMFGFSGGGHFTHRFMYLHPERLSAVCIGSPGSVTLLDNTRDWWVGIRNAKELFGREIDYAALSQVRAHLVVGAVDTETWEITHAKGSKRWMEGANDAGVTRIERNTALFKSLQSHGVVVTQDIVPNVSHSMIGVLPLVKDFFYDFITRSSKGEVA